MDGMKLREKGICLSLHEDNNSVCALYVSHCIRFRIELRLLSLTIRPKSYFIEERPTTSDARILPLTVSVAALLMNYFAKNQVSFLKISLL